MTTTSIQENYTINDIFELFDRIGCCTFATIDGEYPETRIAHFLVYDEEGIYFMTMNTKPFYKQLKATGKVSVCGLAAATRVVTTEENLLEFDPGYFIRLTSDVREVTINEIKAKNNPAFRYCIEDNERYPAMTAFVIYHARGEVYDYDFDKIHRSHKLERRRFAYGGMKYEPAGLTILTDKCIGCGICQKGCSFNAIEPDGEKYRINPNRCDECGDCFTNCPAGAVRHKGA